MKTHVMHVLVPTAMCKLSAEPPHQHRPRGWECPGHCTVFWGPWCVVGTEAGPRWDLGSQAAGTAQVTAGSQRRWQSQGVLLSSPATSGRSSSIAVRP